MICSRGGSRAAHRVLLHAERLDLVPVALTDGVFFVVVASTFLLRGCTLLEAIPRSSCCGGKVLPQGPGSVYSGYEQVAPRNRPLYTEYFF